METDGLQQVLAGHAQINADGDEHAGAHRGQAREYAAEFSLDHE